MTTPLDIDALKSGGKGVKGSGGWISTLLEQMLKHTDFKFACLSFGKTKKVISSNDHRIDSYFVPGAFSGRVIKHMLRICRDIVNKWKPDLIHFHGTEAAYGLLTARCMVEYPAIISMQGLMGPCSEFYHYFGNNSLIDIVRMHRLLEFPAMRGHWIRYLRTREIAKREREIIIGNKNFMGRTDWDRAYTCFLNPTAKYFHCGEMLRYAFWQERWNISRVKRHRIIFTNAGGYPRKGIEILLDAVKILKQDLPDVQLVIAGGISKRSGYGRFISKRISELSGAAIEIGQLTAEEIVQAMIHSHIFVSPSFIDNSPNAVCEAQLLGMPVISTYTGGIPSLIEDGHTGLFVPTGDAPMLAEKLRNVFDNDNLAIKIGAQAHEVAVKRHDPDIVIDQILKAYNVVIEQSK